MGLLSLFAVVDSKSLVLHSESEQPFTCPSFYTGNQVLIDFYLLQRSFGGGFLHPWAKLAPAGYSLKIGVYIQSSSLELASQTVFTDDSVASKKTGALIENSTNITATFTGAVVSVECWLECQVTDGAGNIFTALQQAVTYKKAVMPAGAVTTPPGEVGATQNWVKGLFVPKDGSAAQNPCDMFFVKSIPGGYTIKVYWDDAGQMHAERQSG